MKRQSMRRLISCATIVIFIGWIVYYIRNHVEDFRVISQVSLWNVVVLYVLCCATIVCNGLFIKFILNAYHLEIKWPEWLSLTVVTSASNYMMPLRGGAGMRAVYLKTRFQFGYSDFVSTMMANFIIYFLINGLTGAVSMIVLYARGTPLSWPIFGLFCAVTMISCFVILIRRRVEPHSRFPMKQISRMLNGWHGILGNRRLLVQFGAISIALMLTTAGQIYASFDAFGLNLTWAGIFCYTASQGIAQLITITPGALGIQEAMSVYMGGILHYTTAQALLVQGLWRIVTLFAIFSGAPIAFHVLSLRSRPAPTANAEKPLEDDTVHG